MSSTTITIDEALLVAQLADSAFPSGAFTFSWGIEGLAGDGLLNSPADLAKIVEEQITLRWAGMDRPLLARAHAAPDPEAVLTVDREAEAATASAPLRAGSRRAGRRLLGVFAGRGYPDADSYRDLIRDVEEAGHLPVVQGLVFRAAGLEFEAALVVSGWTTASGLVSAALRLGIVGHRDAQDILDGLRPVIAEAIAAPIDPAMLPWSFTPVVDIALARSSGRQGRMFTT
ncbi:urease accessory protein UreF [Mesorhizobium australicum]|jgi:urease accessory protein|uniref:Urease accessory protein UreF n=1 Tax=Mesorhizobium australicum TaxID=536018 RepID=A0A1X7MRS9_9HYPH|nr:urease accessory UreF family protein [Mesorhizobium australicum]SMH26827.1 urease accessory protein [Mesorhizobium australicum]